MYTLCLLSFFFASGFQIYLHVPQTIILMGACWSTALWQEVNLKANSVTKFCNHRLTESPCRVPCRIHQRFYPFFFFFWKGYVWWKVPQAFDCTSHSIKTSVPSAFQCRFSWEYIRQRSQKGCLQQQVTGHWRFRRKMLKTWNSHTYIFSFLHHNMEYLYCL